MSKNSLEKLLDQAQAICAERGVRLTAQRREVLAIIHQANQPIGAYEILGKMRRGRGKVAPPTVYRALEFLRDAKLVHKLETLHAFVACDHPDHPHSSKFLICTECGEVDELESAGIDGTLTDMARTRGFRPEAQTVEISGTCADCNQRRPE